MRHSWAMVLLALTPLTVLGVCRRSHTRSAAPPTPHAASYVLRLSPIPLPPGVEVPLVLANPAQFVERTDVLAALVKIREVRVEKTAGPVDVGILTVDVERLIVSTGELAPKTLTVPFARGTNWYELRYWSKHSAWSTFVLEPDVEFVIVCVPSSDPPRCEALSVEAGSPTGMRGTADGLALAFELERFKGDETRRAALVARSLAVPDIPRHHAIEYLRTKKLPRAKTVELLSAAIEAEPSAHERSSMAWRLRELVQRSSGADEIDARVIEVLAKLLRREADPLRLRDLLQELSACLHGPSKGPSDEPQIDHALLRKVDGAVRLDADPIITEYAARSEGSWLLPIASAWHASLR